MKEENIPDLKDMDWGERKELGTVTEVIEYIDGGKKKQVKVTAHTVSSESIMAIEAMCTHIDEETKEEKLDSDEYIMELLCRTFDIERTYLMKIFSNKSHDLRNKLVGFMNRVCGVQLKDKEIEKEKNSQSPQS